MVVAAFIFGLVVVAFSLFFLLLYVKSHKSMRENHSALVRQREYQSKLQADLQARMDMDARKYDEARQALLKQAGGSDDAKRRNIGHAA